MPAQTSSSRVRIARHRATQRSRGLRPVVLWLPNLNDPDYRTRLAEECRQLAALTAAEEALAEDFAQLTARADGWR